MLVLLLLCLTTVQSQTEFPVFSSQLSVVLYDNSDFEFELKNRGNLTVEINPTATFSSTNSSLRNVTITRTSVNQTNTLVDEEAGVALVSSLYFYDKSTVEIFRKFLNDPEKLSNISSRHRDLLKRYVTDWDEFIHDPETNQTRSEPLPDLDPHNIDLPREIEEMYKLVRMANRVRIELPAILQYSRNSIWTDVALEVEEKELQSRKYFSQEDANGLFMGMQKLSEIYFSHPSKLYPKELLSKIPIEDLVSIALSGLEYPALKEPLKWLDFAQDVLKAQRKSSKQKEKMEIGKNTLDSPLKKEEENEETQKTVNKERRETNSSKEYTKRYLNILRNILSSHHDYALKNAEYGTRPENLFREPLSRVSVKKQMDKDSTNVDLKVPSLPTYEELCSGVDRRNPKETTPLKCKVDSLNSPWHILMPVKVEELNKEPKILQFHQVLSDSKIRKLQQLSLPLQRESQVGSLDPNRKVNTKIRASFVTFLEDDLSPEMQEINKITGYLTGLEATKIEDAEMLQVNVYTAGGHYRPHMDTRADYDNEHDFTADERVKLKEEFETNYPDGDRFATLMFYLNDVKAGGRTVFTKLGVSIAPEKGSAVLWFSLFDSGDIDGRLEHAGCPVISGLKWVVNKWVNYNSQLFRRPCTPVSNLRSL